MNNQLTKKQKEKYKRKIDLMGWVLPIGLLFIWYFVSENKNIPSYILPDPKRLAHVLWDFLTGTEGLTAYSGTLWAHLSVSLYRVMKGFLTASLLGITLGYLTGRNKLLKRVFDPMIHALRAVPGIGWLPIALVWFSVGEKSTHFLISLAAFFPVYMNTQQGASVISTQLLQAGRMMGAKGMVLFFTVTVPASFEQVCVGLRLALGISFAYLVLGEVTGVNKGIGAVMSDARMFGHTDMVLACMIVIAAAGKLSDFLLMKSCRLFR